MGIEGRALPRPSTNAPRVRRMSLPGTAAGFAPVMIPSLRIGSYPVPPRSIRP